MNLFFNYINMFFFSFFLVFLYLFDYINIITNENILLMAQGDNSVSGIGIEAKTETTHSAENTSLSSGNKDIIQKGIITRRAW